jgi:uncharacterized protein YjiS (DUF1127 family)
MQHTQCCDAAKPDGQPTVPDQYPIRVEIPIQPAKTGIMSRRLAMAITTFDRGLDAPGGAKGFARRLLDRYIDAQMQRAQLRVNAALQRLDNKTLSDLGYTSADITNIRRAEASISLLV